jgi:hypothetical protein
VDGYEEKHAHADLNAALDCGPQKVEGEDGVGDDSKQGKRVVQLNDDRVHEGAETATAVEHECEHNLQDP